jgi:DNA-binding transcriptional MerR regulator
MREVMQRTGLSRQAIHFYVAEGLVPPPEKTGQTMAYYSAAHVERIQLVRRLAEEHFLPLKAIRAMLDDRVGDMTRAQREVLRDVKARLPASTTVRDARPAVALAPLLARLGLPRRDVSELERAGLVRVTGGKVSGDDAWLIELWRDVRAAGFTRELGFSPEVLAIFERGVEQMFAEEKQILQRLAAELPAARVAELVERALPLIHAYLVRLHHNKVRGLFEELS